MSKTNRILLKPVLPSYAIGSKYRMILAKMLKAMIEDVNTAILDLYERNNKIAYDSVVDDINQLLSNKAERWSNYFNLRADPYASNFIDEVDKDVSRQLKRAFVKANIEKLAIGLSKPNKMALQSNQALVEFNIGLIKSIPQEYHKEVQNLVNEGLASGNGKTWLAKKLQSLSQISKNRSLLISRDQLRKATSLIDNTRRIGLGITKAIWRHSKGDKVPRKSHLAANGKEYNITRGCYIDQEWIQVGQKINCTCYSESVVELD